MVCVIGSKQKTGVSKAAQSSHIWLKTKLRIDSEILNYLSILINTIISGPYNKKNYARLKYSVNSL